MSSRGGDFFGEGTYGCTFSPPPACTKEKHISSLKPTNKLGKVFKTTKNMNTELKFANIMVKVDPKQRFFLYPISSCTTTVGDIMKDPQAGKCSYINSKTMKKPNKEFPMMNMPKGGKTLEQYVQSTIVSPREFCDDIMIPLLKALNLLRKHDLVHHDLKFDNILYDGKSQGVKIIDFGLMVPMSGVYDNNKNHYLYSDYWLHPPEYRVLQMIDRLPPKFVVKSDDVRELSQKNLKLLDIRFDASDPQTLREIIIDSFVYPCKYEEAFVKYVMHITKSQSRATSLEFLKKQSNKIDVYSLGITAAYLSLYLDFSSDAQKKKFLNIVQALTFPDPRKRPSPTRAITMIQNTRL